MIPGKQAAAREEKCGSFSVDCRGGCVGDELEESPIMNEGGDEEENFFRHMSNQVLADSIKEFADFLDIFSGHCLNVCQKYGKVREKFLHFQAQLREAREERASRQKLAQ